MAVKRAGRGASHDDLFPTSPNAPRSRCATWANAPALLVRATHPRSRATTVVRVSSIDPAPIVLSDPWRQRDPTDDPCPSRPRPARPTPVGAPVRVFSSTAPRGNVGRGNAPTGVGPWARSISRWFGVGDVLAAGAVMREVAGEVAAISLRAAIVAWAPVVVAIVLVPAAAAVVVEVKIEISSPTPTAGIISTVVAVAAMSIISRS